MILDPKRQQDGFISLEGGVDSGNSPSILQPNQLSWAVNAVTRRGFVTCRPGFRKVELTFQSTNTQAYFENGRFQGAGSFVSVGGQSYLVSSQGGRVFAVRIGSSNVVTEISISGDYSNPNQPKAWFQQAENWLVIQDSESRPILWNGSVSRRSSTDEVPVGGPMAYGRGRLWVANGRQYVGGNLVGSEEGYGNQNVIRFTENTYIAEGGSFAIPSSSGGTITGMAFAANIDTSLGDGDLLVFTERDIYAFDAPIDRDEWKNLTYPIQRFALLDYGTFSHTSICRANGDLFFRSQDGIRSYMYARRDFATRWGNTPISHEVERALDYDTDRLLYACSSVNFDNRMLMTVVPTYTAHGVYHKGLVVMDFEPVSAMAEKMPPTWQGVWTGLNFLSVVKVAVDGEDRCFTYILNEYGVIELWEITRDSDFDYDANINSPIGWIIETRSMGMKSNFEGKKLEGADLWIDNLRGEVSIDALFRADLAPCWKDWATAEDCATYRDCAATANCFVQRTLRSQTRNRVSLPKPPDHMDTLNGTLSRYGGEFQVRLEISGKLSIRKFRLIASSVAEDLYGTDKTTTCVAAETATCQTDACKEESCNDSCGPNDYGYVTPDEDANQPIVPEVVVYYGRSAETSLSAEEIVADLTQATVDQIAGTYSYGSGSGYLYIALPEFPTSIKEEGFDISMASVAQGYTLGSDPMRYRIVTIDGELYYVFRTYNICLGSIAFDVA